jgi:lipopolysaccharide export system permease protein
LAALNLAVLAIPLAFVNPRAGRANNLIFALLTYMIYSNLLSVSQAWVAQGKLRFEIGVWAVHVGMFVFLSCFSIGARTLLPGGGCVGAETEDL